MKRTNQITVAWVNSANIADHRVDRMAHEFGGIYKTHKGFVVTLDNGKALPGYYGTVAAAQHAREKASQI